MNFQEFCEKNNIVVNIITNIGTKIRGFCYYDGFRYIVILNNRFSSEQLKETVVHEVIHVMQNHFSRLNGTDEVCEKEVKDVLLKMRYAFT